ncbi:hypothetical protein NQ318_010147 [Aromia moschata]|uniref:Uncharacterized protein n=1 Tax=Aromia moschata TaxID=1265417 RepID=A0AAV8XRR6_9CUCU|nr:hypothetical protein NQ318_010147 [Aromia moschata]
MGGNQSAWTQEGRRNLQGAHRMRLEGRQRSCTGLLLKIAFGNLRSPDEEYPARKRPVICIVER